jgi:hypothetical protein
MNRHLCLIDFLGRGDFWFAGRWATLGDVAIAGCGLKGAIAGCGLKGAIVVRGDRWFVGEGAIVGLGGKGDRWLMGDVAIAGLCD